MKPERGPRAGRRKKKRAAPARADQATHEAASKKAIAQARQMLGAAAAGMLAGIGLVATGDTTFGPWISVLSMALGIGAAHTLGRCGPDEGSRAIFR
jgi:F0F1-type ATP synthase assembly protein I